MIKGIGTYIFYNYTDLIIFDVVEYKHDSSVNNPIFSNNWKKEIFIESERGTSFWDFSVKIEEFEQKNDILKQLFNH